MSKLLRKCAGHWTPIIIGASYKSIANLQFHYPGGPYLRIGSFNYHPPTIQGVREINGQFFVNTRIWTKVS